jgi:hypothetical protein
MLAKKNVEELTGGSNFSESTTEHRITVPTGKRYYVFCGSVDPDNNSTVTIRVKSSGGKTYGLLMSEAATTTLKVWGSTVESVNNSRSVSGIPYPLDAGDYVQVEFGAAQGATSEIVTAWLEVNVD